MYLLNNSAPSTPRGLPCEVLSLVMEPLCFFRKAAAVPSLDASVGSVQSCALKVRGLIPSQAHNLGFEFGAHMKGN